MLNRTYIQLEQVAATLDFYVACERTTVMLVDQHDIASQTHFSDYDTLLGNVMDALRWLTTPSVKESVTDYD